MTLQEQISNRFSELIERGEQLLRTRRQGSSSRGDVVVIAPDWVDSSSAEQWATSSTSFLRRVMGSESEHYIRFNEHAERPEQHSRAERALAVLKAAKEDFEGGWIFEMRKRIEAEVFDDFLQQAEALLNDREFQISAVIAGAVLEDGLRKLSTSAGLILPDKPALDWMNSELAKKGTYEKLVQKKVTWLADIRNKAAHGQWDKFTKADAIEMVAGVRRFMTDHFSS